MTKGSHFSDEFRERVAKHILAILSKEGAFEGTDKKLRKIDIINGLNDALDQRTILIGNAPLVHAVHGTRFVDSGKSSMTDKLLQQLIELVGTNREPAVRFIDDGPRKHFYQLTQTGVVILGKEGNCLPKRVPLRTLSYRQRTEEFKRREEENPVIGH